MPTQDIDLHFPFAGLDVATAYCRQPNKPVISGEYARSAAVGYNVRGFDAADDRFRGGARSGLSKYIGAQVNGTTKLIQEMRVVIGSGYSPPGGNMQSSQSGRVVTLLAISQGVVKVASPGDTVWSPVTNNTAFTPALNATGVIYSAVNNQKLWFADGANWVYYVPATNSLETWTASAGTLPVDSAGNKPRLIETWRGRTVLSGLLFDPQNWFMSKINDPTNFDYSPLSQSPDQAVAGNNSQIGLIGDVITGIIPFSDDLLVFLGDHTTWAIRGDPMAGGQIDRISDVIGGA